MHRPESKLHVLRCGVDSIAMLALSNAFHLRFNRNACTFCKPGALTLPCTCCSCKGKMVDKMAFECQMIASDCH